jgi:hypothetical protein
MKQSTWISLGTVVALALCGATSAQVGNRGDAARHRNQGGSVNLAPPDPILQVVSVDSYSRTVQMRGEDGKMVNVFVGEGVYPLSKLNPGDKVQVNFLVPDGSGSSKQLKAANIWPVK